MRWQQFNLGAERKPFTRVGKVDTAHVIPHDGITNAGGRTGYDGRAYGAEGPIDLL
jgi:hypothetical protein